MFNLLDVETIKIFSSVVICCVFSVFNIVMYLIIFYTSTVDVLAIGGTHNIVTEVVGIIVLCLCQGSCNGCCRSLGSLDFWPEIRNKSQRCPFPYLQQDVAESKALARQTPLGRRW